MSEPVVLRVADYLALVNAAISRQVAPDQMVEGEVSDYRVSQNKWVTFVLKDEEQQAILPCFMTIWQLSQPLEDGMRVRARGRAGVTARFGKFQLTVDEIVPVGEGALKRAYELLKKKLLDEGVFDAARKRPIPRFPERIGLITSRDAAAYGDFLRVLGNRWGGVGVDFYHIHVQGREAVGEIEEAFAHFNRLPEDDRPDVLVLVRGGGGLEDLHAFNDERSVRAVFGSRIPVVVGVGHERDESLCDFAADMRASTPSNAAERVVPNRQEILFELDAMAQFGEDRLAEYVVDRRHRADAAVERMARVLDRRREDVFRAIRTLQDRVTGWLPPIALKVEGLGRVLAQVDPTRVLSRGYAIVRAGSKVVSDAGTLNAGATVSVQLARKSFEAQVTAVEGKKGQQALI